MFKKFFSKKHKEVIPDKPLGFGFKNKWLAIRANDMHQVADFLKIKNIENANWTEGLAHGYKNGVFITPEVNGWILVLGYDVSDLETIESRALLERTSKAFGECQLFLTHRIIDYHFWGKAIGGKISRLYSYVGESGENMVVEGEPTPAEMKYQFINTLSKEAKDDTYWENENFDFPDENIVMEIAGKWSVDPSKIEEYNLGLSFGLIGN